jgi:hypothetical protein
MSLQFHFLPIMQSHVFLARNCEQKCNVKFQISFQQQALLNGIGIKKQFLWSKFNIMVFHYFHTRALILKKDYEAEDLIIF